MIEMILWIGIMISILGFMLKSHESLYLSTINQQQKWQMTYENFILR